MEAGKKLSRRLTCRTQDARHDNDPLLCRHGDAATAVQSSQRSRLGQCPSLTGRCLCRIYSRGIACCRPLLSIPPRSMPETSLRNYQVHVDRQLTWWRLGNQVLMDRYRALPCCILSSLVLWTAIFLTFLLLPLPTCSFLIKSSMTY